MSTVGDANSSPRGQRAATITADVRRHRARAGAVRVCTNSVRARVAVTHQSAALLGPLSRRFAGRGAGGGRRRQTVVVQEALRGPSHAARAVLRPRCRPRQLGRSAERMQTANKAKIDCTLSRTTPTDTDSHGRAANECCHTALAVFRCALATTFASGGCAPFFCFPAPLRRRVVIVVLSGVVAVGLGARVTPGAVASCAFKCFRASNRLCAREATHTQLSNHRTRSRHVTAARRCPASTRASWAMP